MDTLAQREGKEVAPQEGRTQPVDYVTPLVNIHQDADGYTLEAEMPGVGKGDVEVTFEDGKLTLIGHRRLPAELGREVYRESSEASYRRIFDLDPSIDGARIEASIDQGLLSVRLPKAEAARPRKIAVK